jgi:hypothetical protein
MKKRQKIKKSKKTKNQKRLKKDHRINKEKSKSIRQIKISSLATKKTP